MRNDMKPGILLIVHFLQNTLQHIQIQLIDLTCILQVRDKLRRGEEAALRIDPSGQSLFITDMPAHSPYDRLVIYRDPFLRDRPVKICQDILPHLSIIPKFRVVVVIA